MRDRAKDVLAFAAALALALPLLAGCVAAVPTYYYPAPEPVVVYPAPVVVFPYFWYGPGWYGGHYYHGHPGHYGHRRQ